MGLKVKETVSTKEFTPAPAGLHRAVCVAYIDLGTQEGEWQGEVTRKPKVMFVWELPDEPIIVDGVSKPQTVHLRLTNSLHEKSGMRHHLESWRGRAFTDEERGGFDLDNILGKACQVNVIHEADKNDKRKVWAKVTAVLPLSKGMAKPTASIAPWRYVLEDDGYNFPEQMTDHMKKLLLGDPADPKRYKGCLEMRVANDLPGSPYGQSTMQDVQDDITDNPALAEIDDIPF